MRRKDKQGKKIYCFAIGYNVTYRVQAFYEQNSEPTGKILGTGRNTGRSFVAIISFSYNEQP